MLDLVGEVAKVAPEPARAITQIPKAQVRSHRRVSARDVEPHARHAHLVAVRGHAPDRHDVPQMTIRHERRVIGPLGDPRELVERLFLVLPEDVHGISVQSERPGRRSCPKPGRPMYSQRSDR